MINDFTLEEKIDIVSDNLTDKTEEEVCEEYGLTEEELREMLNEFYNLPEDSELYYRYQLGINEKKLNKSETAIRMYRQSLSYVVMHPGTVSDNEVERMKQRTSYFEKEAEKQRAKVAELKEEYKKFNN